MALAGFAALSAQAQDQEGGDTSKVKDKSEAITFPTNTGSIEIIFHSKIDSNKTTDIKPSKPEPRDFWQGLDMGFSSFIFANGTTNPPAGAERFTTDMGKSGHFGFNIWELGVPIYKNKIVFVTGLGVEVNRYRFTANYNPMSKPDTNGNYVTRDYITNRLITSQLNIPVMLGFDFGKEEGKGWNLSFGAVGSIVYGAKMKEKYTEDNTRIKKVTYDDYYMNPFRLNARVKVGYGSIGVFANYTVTPMFKSGSGMPDMHPFSLGVSIG